VELSVESFVRTQNGLLHQPPSVPVMNSLGVKNVENCYYFKDGLNSALKFGAGSVAQFFHALIVS
jgi:hypothetical protein